MKRSSLMVTLARFCQLLRVQPICRLTVLLIAFGPSALAQTPAESSLRGPGATDLNADVSLPALPSETAVLGDPADADVLEEDLPQQPSTIPGLEDTPTPESFVQFSNDTMALSYPGEWTAGYSEAGNITVTNVDADGSDQVVTEVFQVAAPPGPLVDANIDSFIEEGAAVSRYRSVTIDGQTALIIWLADRPEDLSYAIATFIGYGDETIFFFTRYRPESLSAETEILQMHRSFEYLSAVSSGAAAEEL